MADVVDTAKLIRALAGQKALYRELLELAKLQSHHVATGDNEGLMAVLAQRSRLIDQVAPLDVELQPYKGRWQAVLDGLPAGERPLVAGLLKEVQQLLGEILVQDEMDKGALERQKADVGTEIKRAVTGVALNRAYGVKPRAGTVIG